MIDTLALVKEASYAFLGGPLARGNFREAKSSGYLPFVVHPDAVQTGFQMRNMQAPHGWDPKIGAVKFDGVDSYVVNENPIDVPKSSCAVFVDGLSYGQTSIYQRLFALRYDADNEIITGRMSNSDSYQILIDGGGRTKSEYRSFVGSNRIRQTLINDQGIFLLAIDNDELINVDPEVDSVASIGNYDMLYLGSQGSNSNYLYGQVNTCIVFPRTLTQEESTWLHEQSLLGFPGLRADAYGPNNEFAKLSRARRRSFGLGGSVSCSVGC